MLKDVTFTRKIVLMQVIVVVGILLQLGLNFNTRYNTMMEEERHVIKAMTDAAYSVVQNFHQKAIDGDLTTTQAQTMAKETLRQMRYEGSEYFWIHDMDLKMVMHPFKPQLEGQDLSNVADPNGKKLYVHMVDEVKDDGKGFVDYMWPKPGKADPVDKFSHVHLYKPWGWIIGTSVYVDEIQSNFMAYVVKFGIAALIMISIVIGLAIYMSRTLHAGLHRLQDAFDELANYNLNIRIHHYNNDEMGHLSAVFNKVTDSLRELVSGVSTSTTTISNNVANLKETSSTLSAASNEQQSALAQISAATEESAGTIQEISKLANDTTSNVESIAQSSKAADEAMETLKNNSQEIIKVTQVIEDISEQINLLALNAAIEAARAGEAGRGFAVVADEVRKLAANTNKSTQEIGKVINMLQSDVDTTGSALHQITGSVNHITDAVEQISQSLEQQSDVTADVARTVNEFSDQMNSVTESITGMDDATRDVATSTTELETQISKFKL